jgi:hypothetical protein
MRNFYTAVILLFATFLSNAQVINFPDANLKAKLLEASPDNEIAMSSDLSVTIDTNGNGEIEISEALPITYLDINGAQISDLTGIGNFVNLEILFAYTNQLTNVDLSALTQLNTLLLNQNELNSLDVSMLPELYELQFKGSPQFTTLDVSQNPQLTVLEFTAPLTSLILDGAVNLYQIYAGGIQIQALNLNMCPLLYEVGLLDSEVESLDFSGTHCAMFQIWDSPALKQLFMKNGVPTEIYIQSGDIGLEFVCADENEIITAAETLQDYAPNCVINSYCSFVPGGEYYTVSGSNTWDANGNGCDAQDPFFGNLLLTATSDAGNAAWISDDSGNFSIPVQAGSYVISPVLENPTDFTVSPPSIAVDFPADGDAISQNFCISPVGSHPDLDICLAYVAAAVPGYDAEYQLIVKNTGNVALNGSIQFNFNDQTLDFISSDTAPSSQSPGFLQFALTDFLPFQTGYINIVLNLNGPMEIPPLNADDILNFTISSTVTAGTETINETALFQQTVVNSFDPNDKTCLEGTTVGADMAGEYVHYMIRFENTGTFPAQNIVVKDVIDTAQFDVMSLQPVAASHGFTTRINDNVVEFIFENIDLPVDDANNDGWIVFRIKTLPTLVVGDTFENSARIFFDYNFPIVTEPAITTIENLSVSDIRFNENFTLYPNPVRNVLQIQNKDDKTVDSIEVFNITGQLLIVVANAQNITGVDVSHLTSGVYLVKLKSDGEILTMRFLKK